MKRFTILINDLMLNVIIGILEQERKERQNIIVNAQIEYDEDKHFLDYVDVVEAISNLLEYKQYDTIENALEDVAKALKLDFPEILSIKMSILKPRVYKNCQIGVEFLKNY